MPPDDFGPVPPPAEPMPGPPSDAFIRPGVPIGGPDLPPPAPPQMDQVVFQNMEDNRILRQAMESHLAAISRFAERNLPGLAGGNDGMLPAMPPSGLGGPPPMPGGPGVAPDAMLPPMPPDPFMGPPPEATLPMGPPPGAPPIVRGLRGPGAPPGPIGP